MQNIINSPEAAKANANMKTAPVRTSTSYHRHVTAKRFKSTFGFGKENRRNADASRV